MTEIEDVYEEDFELPEELAEILASLEEQMRFLRDLDSTNHTVH